MRVLVSIFFIAATFLYAQEIKIASGAGYKAPVMEVISQFEKETPHKVYALFGNMKQVSAQAADGEIALVLGDKKYLFQKSGLAFRNFVDVGEGKPVLAYPKNRPLAKLEDIASHKVQRLVMPQPKKTIYGIAADEILENSALKEIVSQKIYEVATAPQAATYILTGEVDAGFINLTAALANKDKIGGYIRIDPKFYTPIIISVGELEPCNNEACSEFLIFLQGQKARKIFEKYGL